MAENIVINLQLLSIVMVCIRHSFDLSILNLVAVIMEFNMYDLVNQIVTMNLCQYTYEFQCTNIQLGRWEIAQNRLILIKVMKVGLFLRFLHMKTCPFFCMKSCILIWFTEQLIGNMREWKNIYICLRVQVPVSDYYNNIR